MPDRDTDSQGSAIDGLARQVEALARRVAKLEDRLGAAPAAMVPEPLADLHAPEIPARTVPLVGHALLAIAGAYFLRAMTEIGALPLAAGVAAGILYAVAWLAFSARTAAERRIEVVLRALTAVLVFAPLIWEATVRFRALPTPLAAALVASFTILGLAVSWRKNVSAIAWIATFAGVVTSWALLLGTRDSAPFAFAMLAILAAVEVSACLEHWLPERWVAAAGADLAVLLITYLATRAEFPDSYAPLPAMAAPAAQAALLGTCLASTIFRTLVRRFPFTHFEVAQVLAAFLIGIAGTAVGAGRAAAAAWAMPAFTLLCGAACYAVFFALRDREHPNASRYSWFGLLLTLAGSATLFRPAILAMVWSGVGLLASTALAGSASAALRWHGILYLLLSAFVSGLAMDAGALLLGGGAGLAKLSAAKWTAAAAIALSYIAGARASAMKREHALALSAMLAGIVSGVAAGWLTGMIAESAESAGAYRATLRTSVLTLGSVALAAAGVRWGRRELVWLVYPMMLLAAGKLVAQDLRGNRTMALFLSILLFGGSLTVLPRLMQKRRAA